VELCNVLYGNAALGDDGALRQSHLEIRGYSLAKELEEELVRSRTLKDYQMVMVFISNNLIL